MTWIYRMHRIRDQDTGKRGVLCLILSILYIDVNKRFLMFGEEFKPG
jgi:hypothetical protein